MTATRERISRKLAATTAKFEPGLLAMTPGAQELLRSSGTSIVDLLLRHLSGDWGTLDTNDRQANDSALKTGLRILSQYDLAGDRLWILSEASDDTLNRPSTTCLLPEDY